MAQAVEDIGRLSRHLSGMRETYLLAGLKRRYAMTLGLIRAGEDRAEDLAHLAAVIRMVAPDTDLAAIPPVRPYRPQRHTWSRTALDIVQREGRAMKALELARRVIAHEGVQATALRTDWLTVRVGPAHLAEGRFGVGVRHAEHGRQRQGLRLAREEKMLAGLVA